MWPVVLVFLLKQGKKLFLYAFIFITGLLSLLANFVMADGQSSVLTRYNPTIASWFSDGAATIFFLAPFRVFEFAIGASLVWMDKLKPKRNIFAELLMAAGLGLVAYSIFHFTEKTTFPSYNALLPCIGAALVIFSVNARYLGIAVRNRVAVFIGLISYSVYLVHWPLLVFYKYYKITPLSSTEKWALALAAILLGYLMYRFIEQPFRHVRDQKHSLSKAGFGLACASLVLVLALPAATVWANAGWPWRSPELPAGIAAQLKDSKQFHVDQFGGAGFNAPYTWISGGESGVADIVFIGDSHAEQYKTGLKELIGDPHKKNIFFATSSCLILPGLTRVTPGTDWDTICAGVLNKALEVLASSPGAILLIAESWDFQIESAAYRDNKIPLVNPGGRRSQRIRRLWPSLMS